jgi:hypothetical protein
MWVDAQLLRCTAVTRFCSVKNSGRSVTAPSRLRAIHEQYKRSRLGREPGAGLVRSVSMQNAYESLLPV